MSFFPLWSHLLRSQVRHQMSATIPFSPFTSRQLPLVLQALHFSVSAAMDMSRPHCLWPIGFTAKDLTYLPPFTFNPIPFYKPGLNESTGRDHWLYHLLVKTPSCSPPQYLWIKQGDSQGFGDLTHAYNVHCPYHNFPLVLNCHTLSLLSPLHSHSLWLLVPETQIRAFPCGTHSHPPVLCLNILNSRMPPPRLYLQTNAAVVMPSGT